MRLILSIALIAMMISLSKDSLSATDSTTLNSTSITGTLVLNKNTKYLMKGFNYVQAGGVIVIPAGTVIIGEFITKGTLIVQRSGKIIADGTPECPIIFTSERPAGFRSPGDWGGIIILGRAAINTPSGADSAEIEGFGAGLGPIYGGQPVVNNDSSGVLRYIRLEFPGINLTGISGNEINGLTMGGVGSRTVIDYVQVSYSGDDSFEWFGGTVNCKHLIAFKGVDDDWDTDNGFRGKVQFGLSVRDSGIYDVSTSNGFESDNNSNSPVSGAYNNPRTKPIFSNMTVVGPYGQTGWSLNALWGRGSHERRSSLECIYNSIILGWKVGYRFDGTGVANAAAGDTIQVRNIIFGGNVTLADNAANSFNAPAFIQTPSYSNPVFSNASSVQLINPFGIYPNVPLPADNVDYWMPAGTSPALSGSNFSNPNLSGFENVSYVGAFGTSNWTYKWAQFNPKNYTIPTITNYFITVIPEAFLNLGTGNLNSSDTVRAYLRQNSSPFNVVDSALAVIDPVNFTGKFCFRYANSGTYYIQIKHRNSLETWSKNGGESFTQATDNFFSFTSSNTQAYGNNSVLRAGKYCDYSGDVNQDGVIDLADASPTDNDVYNFVEGYTATDVNGDNVTDIADLSFIDNNGYKFIYAITPLSNPAPLNKQNRNSNNPLTGKKLID